MPTLSVVVPFHNEESNATELYSQLHVVMQGLDWSYQFIFVDDGSTDQTYKVLKELAAIDRRVIAGIVTRSMNSLIGIAQNRAAWRSTG